MNIRNIHQWEQYKEQVSKEGHTVIADVYDAHEINSIIEKIEQSDQTNSTFRKSEDLFAIRQFLKELPEVKELILNFLKSINISNNLS